MTRTLDPVASLDGNSLVTLAEPLIPRALNRGLIEARHNIVLFLDDDIIPEPDLVKAHINAHEQTKSSLVAGRVVQPWQQGIDFSRDNEFHFASGRSAWIENFMAGNFSICRDAALKIGGFDEQFVRVAYNFEAEFADRWRKAGHKIYFEPAAAIQSSAGGSRRYADIRRTLAHCATELMPWAPITIFFGPGRGAKACSSFWPGHCVLCSTRHHLRRPWWIPATLIAELAGMTWALALAI